MIQLSSSSLSIFNECKKCFYLDRNHKLSRPRGIFSSLPNAIDGIIKDKMDLYRGSLPPQFDVPELKGFQLYNGADFKKMRHWKTNPLKMTDSKGNTIVGAFDELLYNPTTNEYAIGDYKSKGSEPDLAYGEKYYQKQINLYSRFLEVGGKKIAPFACLFYFWAEPCESNLITFKTKVLFLTPDTKAAEMLFADAVRCLESDITPPSGESCEYCKFYSNRLQNENFAVAQ